VVFLLISIKERMLDDYSGDGSGDTLDSGMDVDNDNIRDNVQVNEWINLDMVVPERVKDAILINSTDRPIQPIRPFNQNKSKFWLIDSEIDL
jgi:hypothetical protein